MINKPIKPKIATHLIFHVDPPGKFIYTLGVKVHEIFAGRVQGFDDAGNECAVINPVFASSSPGIIPIEIEDESFSCTPQKPGIATIIAKAETVRDEMRSITVYGKLEVTVA